MATVCGNYNGIPIYTCISGNDYGFPKGIYLATPDQQFDTHADATDESKWKEDMVAGRLFHIPDIKNFEDASVERTQEEFASGDKKNTRDGKRGYIAYFDFILDQHQELRNYRSGNWRIYRYDENINCFCTSPDGTIIQGLSVSFSDVPTLRLNTGDQSVLSALEILEKTPAELDGNAGRVINPTKGDAADVWSLENLTNVYKVILTQVGVIATNEVVFTVTLESDSSYKADGTELVKQYIDGLDIATYTNFQFLDGTGAVVAPTSATYDSVTDQYTVGFAAFTAGSEQIIPTTDNLFKSDVTTLS